MERKVKFAILLLAAGDSPPLLIWKVGGNRGKGCWWYPCLYGLYHGVKGKLLECLTEVILQPPTTPPSSGIIPKYRKPGRGWGGDYFSGWNTVICQILKMSKSLMLSLPKRYFICTSVAHFIYFLKRVCHFCQHLEISTHFVNHVHSSIHNKFSTLLSIARDPTVLPAISLPY